MKIEVGKSYKTRNGRIATVHGVVSTYGTFKGTVGGATYKGRIGGVKFKWWDTGLCIATFPYPCEGYDLVCESVPPLTDEEITALREHIKPKGYFTEHFLKRKMSFLNKNKIRIGMQGDYTALSTAFEWTASPQGIEYWDEICQNKRPMTDEDFDYLAGLLVGAP